MSNPAVFHYTAVYNDKVYHLAKLTFDPETTTRADTYAAIAAGFRYLAENFDFAGIMEGYEDDGTDTTTGENLDNS